MLWLLGCDVIGSAVMVTASASCVVVVSGCRDYLWLLIVMVNGHRGHGY